MSPSSWWFAPAPARRLATLRVLIGAFAVVYLVVRAPHLIRTAAFPAGRFDPVGPVSLLTTPLPPALAAVLVFVCIALGALFIRGRRFSAVGPAFAVCLLWVLSYRNSWGMVFHTENLLVIHVGILGLSPAGDADPWATDEGKAGPEYGWPIRLLCAATVLTYLIAGVAKVRVAGWDWATSDVLRNYVAYDNIRKAELGDWHSPLGAAMVRHGWVFPPLAIGSLAMELLAPLALLGRRAAMVWCLAAWGFHAGVLAVMAILFPYPLLGFAYFSFFPVERGWDLAFGRIAARFNRTS